MIENQNNFSFAHRRYTGSIFKTSVMSSPNYRELSSKSYNRIKTNAKNSTIDFIGASMDSKISTPRTPRAINIAQRLSKT